jgi:hypothetical protein
MRTTLLLALAFAHVATVSAAAEQAYLVDWEESGEEALGYLADLIRINTVNPPGNETPAALYVQRVLEAEDIPTELLALDRIGQISLPASRAMVPSNRC